LALPSSGIITMEQLRAEFGGPTPIVLQDYYRGGGLVPDSPNNSNVPTSGRIVFPDDFYGASDMTNVDLNWSNISGSGSAINANRTLIDAARISYSRTGIGAVLMRRNGSVVPSNTLCGAGNSIHFEVSSFAATANGVVSVFSDGDIIDTFNYNVSVADGGFF